MTILVTSPRSTATQTTPGRRHRPPGWRPCILAAAMLGLAGGGVAAETAYSFRGIVSDERPRAAGFTLTAQTGQRVGLGDFGGKVRLLYFGYTHCPGICPTTLAEINEALRRLEPSQAARIRVLLVSVDPKRDTPERLAAYLSHFNPAFVGLTGSPDEIARVAAAYGIYYRITEGGTPTEYVVDHTSVTLVVDEAGFVRLLFPFGTSATDMAEDLRHLLRDGPVPAAQFGAERRIVVESAWARPVPTVVTSAELYMVILNRGETLDRLLGADSRACGKLELFESSTDARGMMGMRPVPGGAVQVPPGRVVLEPGGLHLMCTARRADFRPGTRVPVTLRFRDAGEVPVEVVIRDR